MSFTGLEHSRGAPLVGPYQSDAAARSAQTVEVMDAGSSAPTRPSSNTAAATSMRSRGKLHVSRAAMFEQGRQPTDTFVARLLASASSSLRECTGGSQDTRLDGCALKTS
jgi:hypothetical protein